MVVANNLNAINAHNRLGVNVLGTKKASEKLSSGFRVNRAGDDAAGLAVSEKMRAQIRGLSQAIRNANDGINLIQTAEGALEEVHSMLKRMKELAVQSANGTYASNTDREYMDSEVYALKREIDRIGRETDFNGLNFFAVSGVSNEHVFHVGHKISQNIAFDHLMVSMSASIAGGASGVSLAVGISGEIKTVAAANSFIASVDFTINEVNKQRAAWGVMQNRLEHTVSNLTVTNENIQAAESQIRDTDMAKEMVNYTKFNILQQAAQAMLAQANQAPQAVLQLLR